MKKTLTLLLLIMLYSATYAQFVITPQGFRSSDDNDKDYVVYRFDGISQKQLFDRTLFWITNSLNNFNPNISLYSSDNNVILLRKKIESFMSKGIAPMDLEYQIAIYFKDNLIRINTPDTYLSGVANGASIYIGIQGEKWMGRHFYIYNDKGEMKEPEFKAGLESYFNSLCSKISTSVNNTDMENW